MKNTNYIKWYEWFKSFRTDALLEIRQEICFQNKSRENSLKLEVIDDLLYLKDNNIPL
jgi:hypothetical protein